MGGGVEAFRSGEARIGNLQDDDDDGPGMEDGSNSQWAKGKHGHQKLKWNRFKWALFIANVLVSIFLFFKTKLITDITAVDIIFLRCAYHLFDDLV